MAIFIAVLIASLLACAALAGGHWVIALFCAYWAVSTFTEGRKA
jgi:hypothetical protein